MRCRPDDDIYLRMFVSDSQYSDGVERRSTVRLVADRKRRPSNMYKVEVPSHDGKFPRDTRLPRTRNTTCPVSQLLAVAGRADRVKFAQMTNHTSTANEPIDQSDDFLRGKRAHQTLLIQTVLTIPNSLPCRLDPSGLPKFIHQVSIWWPPVSRRAHRLHRL